MQLIYFALAWFAGIAAASFLLGPPIIIVFFGIPFTYEMKRKGVLTSTAPATRYIISFVLLMTLFAAMSWAMWHFFPRFIWAYAVGVLFTIVPRLRACGRTELNIAEFFEAQAEDVDQDALARYLSR